MMERKLPLDLEEEILVRVPPLSLLRFRSVCKEWNNLFKNKRFANKNFACSRQEFMLKTDSKIYSISVNLNEDPTIKVRDLCFDFCGSRYHHLGNCDGYFFMYDFYQGGVVWNPLLRHIKWVSKADITRGMINMGYDGSRPENYKIIVTCTFSSLGKVTKRFLVSEFAFKAWKVTDYHHTSFLEDSKLIDEWHNNSMVSLNGNLYWPARHLETVLQHCRSTREIEIWVTKKKIGNGNDGDDVVWIKFMTIAIPNCPIVCHKSSSYFVDNNIYGKSYVVCCPSKKPIQAWVYIVRGDMCKKIKIDGVACKFQSSVYVPSLITIP